ncbi:MAG TPA: PASTA domain-containing protein [Streptosporangiaceae bacterium]
MRRGMLLHLETVQLTARPLAVEGLVVGQSPPPGTKVRRAATLTVRIWHPPRRGTDLR